MATVSTSTNTSPTPSTDSDIKKDLLQCKENPWTAPHGRHLQPPPGLWSTYAIMGVLNQTQSRAYWEQREVKHLNKLPWWKIPASDVF